MPQLTLQTSRDSGGDDQQPRRGWQINYPRKISGAPGLFPPAYSREFNLIERAWKVAKHCAFRGRYHPTYRGFQAAIPEVVDALPTNCSQQRASLMTHSRSRI